MTDTVVAEGQVKFRDGKKWKTRFVVLRKPSPVADCLSLLVHKQKKKGKEKGSGHKERLSVTLEGICGVEPGPGYDGVSYTLSILCLAHTLVLGFNSRDALLAWDARVCYSLGEVHRFSVNVEPGTKLESGPASLHLCNNLLVLSKGLPPFITGHWKLSALRRYGAVPEGFVFEGGTRCGYWAGVFFLSCSEGEQISFLFDCIVRGITPSRAQHGLRPSLPADPNADPALTEERISQEASELEKRLSRLSQCSLASSTASTYSCSTSVAGDDHSSISSSSSSQSDASYGTRLPFWMDPLARSHLSCDTASSSSTLKPLTSSDDQLYAASAHEARPSSAHIHSRGLHDSGRQSSLDSGIGIATGSQSSYSGSVSSCTGSLDMASQGGGEEFGSIVSLPAPPPPSSSCSVPPSSPPPSSSCSVTPAPPSSSCSVSPFPSSSCSVPPPSPPPRLPVPGTFKPDHSSATSPSSRPTTRSSRRHSDEYQIPNLLRLWYDIPKSLFQPRAQGGPHEGGKNSRSNEGGGHSQGQGLSNSPTELKAQHQAMMQRSFSWDSERGPSVDSGRRSTPRPLLAHEHLVYGETKCRHDLENYITQEQLQTAKNRPSEAPLSEERDDSRVVGNKLSALKRLLPSRPPSAPPPLPVIQRPTPAYGVFQPPHDAPLSAFLDSRLQRGPVNYVNVPISPLLAKTNRELLYTELNLQKPKSAQVFSVHSADTEDGFLRYTHLNIAAMETAQRVGEEHVEGMEDRLSQLESRRRGPPH